MQHIISQVDPFSIAEEIGIKPGDELISVNGKPVNDKLDYMFMTSDEFFTLEIKSADGEITSYEIENPDYEEIGLTFENSLMDKPRACSNRCIFCFIDQLPRGLRKTLYFKDDDSRLSFLQGNYITLTNLSDDDINRIIDLKITPVNVSVHTTNPELRKMMLGNSSAGTILERMKKLADGGIYMDAQIVLCKGINDGDELEKTISDLVSLAPNVNSVSVVPVGLSKYRDKLYPLEGFDKKSCETVIKQIEKWQKYCYDKFENNFIYPADEFYLNAELPVPDTDSYDGFPQIENGVGLIASLRDEIDCVLEETPSTTLNREVSIATGELAYDFICNSAKKLEKHFAGLKINVYKITNNFLGEKITVSGLLCGCDIIEQLKGKNLGETLFLSDSVLRAEDVVLLDDITLSDLEKSLNVNITTVLNDGYDFVTKIAGI